MLAGGLLAKGVRPIESYEDAAYDRAGKYYWFFTTFPGWTYDDVENCPLWLRQRLPYVHAIAVKIAEEKREAAERAAKS